MKGTWPEPEIVTRNGKPLSVIIPNQEYEELLERLGDSADAAWIERVRRKPLEHRPLEAYAGQS
jgi:hypothetical protein